MKPGRKPAAAQGNGWRCWLCPGHPWFPIEEPFAPWLTHYIREHMQKAGA